MSRAALTMTLTLLDGQSSRVVEGVRSLMAADASGQFGVLPAHEALITVLEPGLFRYRLVDQPDWRYGACAGGLLSCADEQGATVVRIVSRRFLAGDEPEALLRQLDALLAGEQSLRLSLRESRGQLDLALMRRLQELAQAAA